MERVHAFTVAEAPVYAVAGAVGFVVLPHMTWILAILVAAVLAATDASLSATVITDTRIAERVRRALNVESGLNDGLATPVVVIALAAAALSLIHISEP